MFSSLGPKSLLTRAEADIVNSLDPGTGPATPVVGAVDTLGVAAGEALGIGGREAGAITVAVAAEALEELHADIVAAAFLIVHRDEIGTGQPGPFADPQTALSPGAQVPGVVPIDNATTRVTLAGVLVAVVIFVASATATAALIVAAQFSIALGGTGAVPIFASPLAPAVARGAVGQFEVLTSIQLIAAIGSTFVVVVTVGFGPGNAEPILAGIAVGAGITVVTRPVVDYMNASGFTVAAIVSARVGVVAVERGSTDTFTTRALIF